MKYLYAFIILAIFSGIFILTYILNMRTKKPDNCKELPSECEHCNVKFCSLKSNIEQTEENK